MKKTTFQVLTHIPIAGPIIECWLAGEVVSTHCSTFRAEDDYPKFVKRLEEFAKAHPDTAITNKEIREILRSLKS